MIAPDTQSVIAAAVTPVVMISANAILIGAISSKHQAMSDRMRALTAESRNTFTTEQRRKNIAQQVQLFNERARWVTWSHIVLYAATACFILMVIDIAATFGNSLSLLITGVTLMFLGILFELFDLAKARKTVALEIKDILM